MKTSSYKIRWLIPAVALLGLCGCVGGPIAQQLATSLIMRGADKITANAYEAQQRQKKDKGVVLKDTIPDEYYGAFITSGFETASPAVEALPDQAQSTSPVKSAAQIEASRLVRVELWNLLVGDEKRSALEKAYLLGSTSLPPLTEWGRWQVATGASEATANKPITFLIPPEFGRIRTGENAIVEIVGQGGLHVARYIADEHSASIQVKGQSALIASQSRQSRPNYSR